MALGSGSRLRPKSLPRRIIFFHILPRLPVSSLQPCRSVCKQWHSFLKSRFFANLHNRHLTDGSSLEARPKLLSIDTVAPWGFRIIESEALASGERLQPLPFVPPADTCYIHAVTSLHGLVCVWVYKNNMSNSYRRGVDDIYDIDLVLWNPLTGESKTLCKRNNPFSRKNYRDGSSLGLYYHAADDDYKLLFMSYDLDMQIYSLKSDSWRNVDSTHNYQTALSHFKPTNSNGWGLTNGICLNGNLYFLYRRNFPKRKRLASIIKFDTRVEKLSVIPTPSSLIMDLDQGKRLSMKVKEGVIDLGVGYGTVYSTTESYIQMWRMIGDHGNWEEVGGHYNGLELFMDNYVKVVRYTESFMSLNRSSTN